MGPDKIPRLNVLDLQAHHSGLSPAPLHDLGPVCAQQHATLSLCLLTCTTCAQVQIRRLPKPVIAMVAGYAVGGGNILQMVCDITVRSVPSFINWLLLCIMEGAKTHPYYSLIYHPPVQRCRGYPDQCYLPLCWGTHWQALFVAWCAAGTSD